MRRLGEGCDVSPPAVMREDFIRTVPETRGNAITITWP